MKIIGTAGDGILLCAVKKDEICRVFNQYGHYSCDDKVLMGSMQIGREIDLGLGYKFRDEIKEVCKNMQEAVKSFNKAQSTLLAFSELIAKTEDAPQNGEAVENIA